MSFAQYLKDKRYFLVFYVTLMLFISLIMLVSVNRENAANNIAYANAGALFFAGVYVGIGYYYRNSFYRELVELIGSRQGSGVVGLPEPQTAGQALYLQMLVQLNAEHAGDLDKLRKEIADHQDFILSWIHEIKLPIAASRLVMENRTGKTGEYLVDKLEDELGKIDGYVEQALYYSRIDSFSRDYFITEVPFDSIVKESIKKYAKLFINKQIRPDLEGVSRKHSVHSDSKWLAYIVNQAVANSLNYTEGGGSITFRSEEDSQEKRLLIDDTGIGIPPEDISRVFDKGFTGSAGRTHAKSTGMGLYLAKRMARKLGHDLSVQSSESAGTRVIIHFPKIRSYRDLN